MAVMATTTVAGYAMLVSDPLVLGGALTLRSARVPVRQIGAYVRDGASLADIMADYPLLDEAEVAEAIRYYGDHRADVDAELERERAADY